MVKNDRFPEIDQNADIWDYIYDAWNDILDELGFEEYVEHPLAYYKAAVKGNDLYIAILTDDYSPVCQYKGEADNFDYWYRMMTEDDYDVQEELGGKGFYDWDAMVNYYDTKGLLDLLGIEGR